MEEHEIKPPEKYRYRIVVNPQEYMGTVEKPNVLIQRENTRHRGMDIWEYIGLAWKEDTHDIDIGVVDRLDPFIYANGSEAKLKIVELQEAFREEYTKYQEWYAGKAHREEVERKRIFDLTQKEAKVKKDNFHGEVFE